MRISRAIAAEIVVPAIIADAGDHAARRFLEFLEKAQTMAAHESPRTIKLYDRTSDEITLDEVERIAI